MSRGRGRSAKGSNTLGTKAEPGAFDCYAKAEDDEPFFTLLARDPFAPILVRLWADMTRSWTMTDHDQDKAAEALECADLMEAWKGDNPDHGR